MPRRAKGPRLHWRADRNTWEVRDGSQRLSLATDCRREAEKALAEYIRQKHRRDGQAPLADFTVGECLSIYATDHAPSIAAPERVAYALNALVPYWGDLALPEITEARCKEYGRIRYKRDGSPVSGGTIRRELNTLQAAINYCHRNNHISGAPRVVLPPHAAPKERWLTVEEAAWLLRAARSLRADGRHLADFILCALYTGSRKATILTLQLNVRNNIGGTADTRTGILYRKPLSKVSTNKRQNNARIPDKYLAHLRRQVANGRRYVVNRH